MSYNVYDLRCEYFTSPLGMDEKNPRFFFKVESDKRGTMQKKVRIQVACGKPQFQSARVWDFKKTTDETTQLVYAGEALKPLTKYYWRVMSIAADGTSSGWSKPASFTTGLIDSANWTAKWIALPEDEANGDQIPHIRKSFTVEKKVSAAYLLMTAYGYYEPYMNGKKVTDAVFMPGWTSYKKHLQYQMYDVTKLIKKGDNASAVILGKGWAAGNLAMRRSEALGYPLFTECPAMLSQLELFYEDGTKETIGSDETFKYCLGPILYSDIYHGETYDARLEINDFSEPAISEANYKNMRLISKPYDNITWQNGEYCRKIEEIKPVSMFRDKAGNLLVDMGQNFVGWTRITVSGKTGEEVVLNFAEVLDSEGVVYNENYRGARATLKYICKGVGRETFEPHFTFVGGRYIKITAWPGTKKPSINNFTGVVIHSDMARTGDFTCSNPLINQLYHNIVWGQKGNFVDIPSDCPQRDERLGWTADAQVFARTAAYNYNVAPFFTKWMADVTADTPESGAIPHVVPNTMWPTSVGATGWGDAACIIPWTVYTCYNDSRILERQYPNMKGWVDYMFNNSTDYMWFDYKFGDWLALDVPSSNRVGATDMQYLCLVFFAYSTQIVYQSAEVLGYKDDVKYYKNLYKNIVKKLRTEYVTSTGRLAVPTQTGCVLAILFDLVEGDAYDKTVKLLIQKLKDHEWHLSTGFLGAPYINFALSKIGRDDLAYKLLMYTDYPSWLYQVTKGATTVWEHWDGIKVDGSFWAKGMNSFNHYAYGSIGDWIFRRVCGLDALEPGYKTLNICPMPGEMDNACATLDTPQGKASSGWKYEDGKITYSIVIPANVQAQVVLPKLSIADITENGVPLAEVEGVVAPIDSGEGAFFILGSGSYEFSAAVPEDYVIKNEEAYNKYRSQMADKKKK